MLASASLPCCKQKPRFFARVRQPALTASDACPQQTGPVIRPFLLPAPAIQGVLAPFSMIKKQPELTFCPAFIHQTAPDPILHLLYVSGSFSGRILENVTFGHGVTSH